jgi:hypothetical protein
VKTGVPMRRITKSKSVEGMAQVLEHLPSKLEVLSQYY